MFSFISRPLHKTTVGAQGRLERHIEKLEVQVMKARSCKNPKRRGGRLVLHELLEFVCKASPSRLGTLAFFSNPRDTLKITRT